MTGFAGFRRGVRFVVDLGFAYVDDGARSFRLEEDTFGRLLEACLGEEAERVVRRYPTIFCLVGSVGEAETTIDLARL